MKFKIRANIIRGIFALFGTTSMSLGFSNIIIMSLLLKNYNIFILDKVTVTLTFFKVSFFIYLIIIGFEILLEKKWVSKGAIPIPFIFILLDYFSKTERTLWSYIVWLIFLFSLFLFCTSATVKNYLFNNDKIERKNLMFLPIYLSFLFIVGGVYLFFKSK